MQAAQALQQRPASERDGTAASAAAASVEGAIAAVLSTSTGDVTRMLASSEPGSWNEDESEGDESEEMRDGERRTTSSKPKPAASAVDSDEDEQQTAADDGLAEFGRPLSFRRTKESTADSGEDEAGSGGDD